SRQSHGCVLVLSTGNARLGHAAFAGFWSPAHSSAKRAGDYHRPGSCQALGATGADNRPGPGGLQEIGAPRLGASGGHGTAWADDQTSNQLCPMTKEAPMTNVEKNTGSWSLVLAPSEERRVA